MPRGKAVPVRPFTGTLFSNKQKLNICLNGVSGRRIRAYMRDNGYGHEVDDVYAVLHWALIASGNSVLLADTLRPEQGDFPVRLEVL